MKEYGGYLPFEFKPGKEYYTGVNTVSLNCARNAIVYSILDAGYKRVYIPFYLCNTVEDALKKYAIKYEVYHLNKDFLPIDVTLQEEEGILYPNYFGLVSDEKINRIVGYYKRVILDNTQAFFAAPNPLAYNVYSCRKFIGVSDGAYVVKDGIEHRTLPRDKSYDRMLHLFKSIEEGTNEAYQENLLAEEALNGSEICEMSLITRKILEMVDYDNIAKRRIENFTVINKILSDRRIQDIERSKECVPMVYPLFCKDKRARKLLIENNIYVPQWWKLLLDYSTINEFERELVNTLLPLPIDQRLDAEAVTEMMNLIIELFEENKIWS